MKICSLQFTVYRLGGCAASIKVSRSQNRKQKIYEILTTPKIQTNGVILNNCIDQVCLRFSRLLLLDLSVSAVQVTYLVCNYFSG